MGYFNTWMSKKDKTEFSEKFLDEVKKIIELSGISIKGELGEGEPIITKHKIVLNGDKKMNNDYETFSLVLNGEIGYCTTRYKSYDIVVKAILMLAQEYGYICLWYYSGDKRKAEYKKIKRLFENSKETK